MNSFVSQSLLCAACGHRGFDDHAVRVSVFGKKRRVEMAWHQKCASDAPQLAYRRGELPLDELIAVVSARGVNRVWTARKGRAK
jgi:hypothetical protein